jgi:hypothetical protein
MVGSRAKPLRLAGPPMVQLADVSAQAYHRING